MGELGEERTLPSLSNRQYPEKINMSASETRAAFSQVLFFTFQEIFTITVRLWWLAKHCESCGPSFLLHWLGDHGTAVLVHTIQCGSLSCLRQTFAWHEEEVHGYFRRQHWILRWGPKGVGSVPARGSDLASDSQLSIRVPTGGCHAWWQLAQSNFLNFCLLPTVGTRVAPVEPR